MAAQPPRILLVDDDADLLHLLGLYLGGRRNACVVAESPAVVYRLSKTALDIMEDREPWLAAAFHKYMARLLSERLVQTNRALRGLLD